MPIETANFVQDLDAANPPGSDDRSQGDNHLRLIKSALKATLPNASKAFRFPSSGATKTASFAVTFPTDQNVAFAIDSSAGAVAVTLPDPTSGGTANEDGFGFWLIRTAGSNSVTVTPAGAQTIMGAASYSIAAIRQYAYLFWSATQARWLVFEGNNPALTYGLQIVTSAETALIVNRTENVLDTEYTLASWRLGSGVGAVAADTYVSGGANDVTQRRRYIGATEIERLTTSLALFNVAFGVGASLRLNPDGYVDFTEIAEPDAPAANIARLYSRDDGGTTRLAYRDSADDETLLHIIVPARAYEEYVANANLSTVIPLDDTIPQDSEGTQILSATITLHKADSRVRARFQGFCSLDTAIGASVALFMSGTADALAAAAQATAESVFPHITFVLEFEHAPGDVGPHTYTVRAGPSASANIRFNGTSVGRYFGGASRATLILEEILV